MSSHKRPLDDAEESGRKSKMSRSEILRTLDPAVSDKLREMSEDGVLREDELDMKALDQLHEFVPRDALDVLSQFSSSNMDTVRNKSAYLCGIMQKVRKYGPGGSQRGSTGLNPSVQHALEELYKARKLRPGDLDARCLDQLRSLGGPVGLEALRRLTARSLREVRNVSAFFTSVVRDLRSENGMGSHSNSGGQGNAHGGGLQSQASFESQSQMQNGAAPTGVQLAAILANKKDYGVEQMRLGVRVEEFHALSVFAPYVHPAPALKLQELWDQGNRLVSLLDDRAWEVLADMGGPEAIAVVDDTAGKLASGGIRNVNAYFMSVVRTIQKGKPPPHVTNQSRGGDAAMQSNQFSMPLQLPNLMQQPVNFPMMPGNLGAMGAAGMLPLQAQLLAQQQMLGGDMAFGGMQQPGMPAAPHPQQVAPMAGGNGLQGQGLSPRLQLKINAVVNNKPQHLSFSHFDSGLVDTLSRMPENDAMLVLDELDRNDLSTVRNMPAFIMGIIKRQKQRR